MFIWTFYLYCFGILVVVVSYSIEFDYLVCAHSDKPNQQRSSIILFDVSLTIFLNNNNNTSLFVCLLLVCWCCFSYWEHLSFVLFSYSRSLIRIQNNDAKFIVICSATTVSLTFAFAFFSFLVHFMCVCVFFILLFSSRDLANLFKQVVVARRWRAKTLTEIQRERKRERDRKRSRSKMKTKRNRRRK